MLRAARDPRQRNRAFVVSVTDVFQVAEAPVDVEIDLGQVGGPSAGLAFALQIMEELGEDVDGYRLAASGEIFLDGSVSRVGGIKQKTIGARRSGMDLFLVPGDNASEARRYAKGLRVVPVDSFQQALRVLATLLRRRRNPRNPKVFGPCGNCRDFVSAPLKRGARGPKMPRQEAAPFRRFERGDDQTSRGKLRRLLLPQGGTLRLPLDSPCPTFRPARPALCGRRSSLGSCRAPPKSWFRPPRLGPCAFAGRRGTASTSSNRACG